MEIQQGNEKNKDAPILYDGATIQTATDANEKWEPGFMLVKIWKNTRTLKRPKRWQKTEQAGEAHGSFGGERKRKADDSEALTADDLMEGENENGQHGLLPKRMAHEEPEEVSRNPKVLKLWGQYYICSKCAKSFDNYPDFVAHQTTHLEPNIYQCAECRRTLGSLSLFIEHQRAHLADGPSTSRVGSFFRPWMLDSLQEACRRVDGGNEQNPNPEWTEPSQSILRGLLSRPLSLESSSPRSHIAIGRKRKLSVRPRHQRIPFVARVYSPPPDLDIPFTFGTFSPFLSFQQKAAPSSEAQRLTGQEVVSTPVLSRQEVTTTSVLTRQKVPSTPVLTGQEEASTPVLTGQEVGFAQNLEEQVGRLHSLSLTSKPEIPERMTTDLILYPCLECEGNFDSPAKLKLHRNECRNSRGFGHPRHFYDKLSLDEHENTIAREFP